jgi:hypothetical protein
MRLDCIEDVPSHSLSRVPTERQVWNVDSLIKDDYNIVCMIVLETFHHIHCSHTQVWIVGSLT